MDWKAFAYVGATVVMFAIFALLVRRTYRRDRKDHEEAAKYRMMDED